jgi:RNA polymerase sigma factor (sigma-70 family)
MPHPSLARTVAHLRRLAEPACGADAELLAAFAARRDHDAFAELVRRHGPMVLATCRRLLGNHQDAEDAFQATFFLLARKAGAVGWRGSASPWLYTTACHVCRNARTRAARRRHHEAAAPAPPPAGDAPAELTARELLAVLDEELARLPERLRGPLVLCYLEGRTRDEAAGQLGWTLGTLKLRLERGRALLRARLTRRGLAPAVGLLALALAPPAVPAGLMRTTADTARMLLAGGSVAGPVAVLMRTGLCVSPAAALRVAAVGLLTGTALTLCVGGRAGVADERPAHQPPVGAAPDVRRDPVGDALPAGAVLRLGATAFAVPDVVSVGFRAGGELLAVDRALNLTSWPLNRPTAPMSFSLLPQGRSPQSFPPNRPAVSADGRLVAGAAEGTVIVWDVTGERPAEVLRRPAGNVYRLLFSTDGAWLAANEVSARAGKLLLCHVPTKAWKELPLPGAYVASESFSADGARLAITDGRTVLVFDTAAGREVMRIAPPGRGAYGVALSPAGDTLAVLPAAVIGAQPAAVPLLAVPSGEPAAGLTPPMSRAAWVAFAPDGKTVLLGGTDGARVWDAARGADVRTLSGPARSPPVFSPDGRHLASHTGAAALVWEWATGRLVGRDPVGAGHWDAVMGVAFSPDGRLIGTDSLDGEVIIWAADTGRSLWRARSSWGNDRRLVFTPDSRALVAVADDHVTPVMYDATTGRVVRRFAVPAERVNQEMTRALRLSPDGTTLTTDAHPVVLAREAFTVRWDVATGEQLGRVALALRGGMPDQSPTYSPDGRWAMTGGRVTRIGTDAESLEVVTPTEAFLGAPSVRFSPDSRFVAHVRPVRERGRSGPARSSVAVLDLATGTRAEVPTGHALRLAFSPDGRILAALGREEVGLWEWATGRRLLRFAVPYRNTVRPEAMAFSPDGRRLVTGEDNGTALIWDVVGVPGVAPAEPAAGDLATAWAALAGDDVAAAYRAEWALARRAADAVALLRDRLKPAPEPPGELAALVKQLDAPRFADRAEADRHLRRLGDAAMPGLRRALAGDLSAEQRQRIEAIVRANEAAFPAAGPAMQTVRAVRVLERIGTAEARVLLKDLSSGPAGRRLTRDAADALERLGERTSGGR